MKPQRHSWLAEWLFTLALRACPAAFRRRFGEELHADFRAGDRPLFFLMMLVRDGLRERASGLIRWTTWPDYRSHLYQPTGGRGMFLDNLRADVRHTIRLAIKAPLYTSLVVFALALGIGANSAIFTVVHSVLLRPLLYEDPERLVMVWSHNTKEGRPRNPLSPANFLDLREGSRSLVDIEGAFTFITSSKLILDQQPEIVWTSSVTPGLLALSGRQAALGRIFAVDEPDGRLLLGNGYWRRRFGADPNVIGRHVTIDGRSATIVGVMPADFVFPYKGMLGPTGFTRSLDVDIWSTMSMTGPQFVAAGTGQFVRNVHFLSAIGRLRAGVSLEQARDGLALIAARLERAYPDSNTGWTTTVVPLHEQVVGETRPALLLLLSAVGMILLMACVNVANLVLARSVTRQKELAVRAAVGATRGRLACQALTESLLLAGAGGAVGLLFVTWGVRALVALAPSNTPRLEEVHPDLMVLLVTIGAAMVTGTLVGLVPAFVAGRTDVRRALQDVNRGTLGSALGRRLRSGLVLAEIALAVVLSVGAGLLLRSFDRLLDLDPGFRAEGLLTLQMSMPDRLTTADQRRAFYAELFERLEAIPGVVSAGGTTRIPLGSTNVTTSIQVEGRDVPPSDRPEVEFRRAMHDYFGTMGIPLIRGRAFAASDGPTAPPVAIVNQTMARRVFGDEDPVGKRIRMGPTATGPWTTIIGVIGDVRHSRLEAAPDGEVYITYLQNPPVTPFIAIRTNGEPADLSERVRSEARAFDPTLAIYDIRTMEQIRSQSVAERRFVLTLISAFGVLSLLLASFGVYGVMSLVVSERTQEVGVRFALGAEPSAVLGMIVGRAVALAAAGIGLGLLLAAALTPLLANQLFGVGALDPVTFIGVPVLLVMVAIVAALVPGWRAMRMDPLTALRYE